MAIQRLSKHPPSPDWTPTGTTLQHRLALTLTGAFWLLSGAALGFGWILGGDTTRVLGPFFTSSGLAFMSFGWLTTMLPWEVHRRGPYGHPPTAAGVRLMGWVFIAGGTLFALVGLAETLGLFGG